MHACPGRARVVVMRGYVHAFNWLIERVAVADELFFAVSN